MIRFHSIVKKDNNRMIQNDDFADFNKSDKGCKVESIVDNDMKRIGCEGKDVCPQKDQLRRKTLNHLIKGSNSQNESQRIKEQKDPPMSKADRAIGTVADEGK
jgi:hypothetical protein